MGWPLLDAKGSGVKLKSEGIKKVSDRELYALNFTPKKRSNNGDSSVLLCFDPATFHHVLTIYRSGGRARRAGRDDRSEQRNDHRRRTLR